MSNSRRVALIVGALVVIVLAAVIAKGSGSNNDNKTVTSATITVKHAKPVGGVQHVQFKKGSQITLIITSDTADNVHFHGYDVEKPVKAGGSVVFSMPAKLDGKFEVELENRKQQLAEVEVVP